MRQADVLGDTVPIRLLPAMAVPLQHLPVNSN